MEVNEECAHFFCYLCLLSTTLIPDSGIYLGEGEGRRDNHCVLVSRHYLHCILLIIFTNDLRLVHG